VLRFLLPMFGLDAQQYFQPFVVFICLVGIIYGGFCALRQIDMKRQIAFSSISHMSFALLGVFTYTEIGIKGGFYLMISHGLTSAALFFLVGALSDRYHTRSVFAYSGLLAAMPVFIFFLILVSLANVGFPGTSGFVPEFFVLVAIVSTSLYFLIPTLLGMFLATAGGLLLVMRVAYGHLKAYSNFNFSDLTRLETFILGSLGILIIWLGISDPWEGIFMSGLLLTKKPVNKIKNTLVVPFAVIFPSLVDETLVAGRDQITQLFSNTFSIAPELILFSGIFFVLLRLNKNIADKNISNLFGLRAVSIAACSVGLQLIFMIFLSGSGLALENTSKYFLVAFATGSFFCLVSIQVFGAGKKSELVRYLAVFLTICLFWIASMYSQSASFAKFSYTISNYTQINKLVLLATYLVAFILIGTYTKFKDEISGKNLYEYTVIYWLIALFSIILISIDNLVVFLIALEGISLASYILPTLGQTRGGVIAAVKYFVFGTLGSIYLIWGVATLYTLHPSLSLTELHSFFATSDNQELISAISRSVQMMLIGFLIKLGAAPAHQ
jgi:NADH:ubiquinone oxidoreductase subunit 4 (subunit M)